MPRSRRSARKPLTKAKAQEPKLSKTARKCNLLRIPLPILFKILSHLTPLDLLCLTRTEKLLRGVLQCRGISAGLWAAARGNVPGLPDHGDLLSEPEYASLMFDTHREHCGAPDMKDVIWTFMARYCESCRKRLLQPVKEPLHTDFRPLSSVWNTEVHPVIKDGEQYMYHIPQQMRVYATLIATENDEERIAYLAGEVARTLKVHEYTSAWQAWAISQQPDGASPRAMRTLRKMAIFARLRKIGYGPELIMGFDFESALPPQSLALFTKAKKLTDGDWGKLKGVLTTFLRLARLTKQALKREVKLRDRMKACVRPYEWLRRLYHGQSFPGFADFLKFPEVKELVDAPDNVVFDPQQLIQLRPRMFAILERWNTASYNALTVLIKHQIDVAVGVSALALAAAVFMCECGKYRWYPEIVEHHCLNELRPPGETERDTESIFDPWSSALERETARMPYSATCLTKHLVVDVVSHVIIACGMDPSRATKAEMDALQCRLYDADDPPRVGKLVRDWRTAVKESLCVPVGSPRVKLWTQVAPDEANAARIIEARSSDSDAAARVWCCARCEAERFMAGVSMGDMEEHLKDAHDVDNMDQDDYYRLLDADPFARLPVTLK